MTRPRGGVRGSHEQPTRSWQAGWPVGEDRFQAALKSPRRDDDVSCVKVVARPATQITHPDSSDPTATDNQILRYGCPAKSDVRVLEARAIDRFNEAQPFASRQVKPGDGIAGRTCEILEGDAEISEPVIEPFP